MASNVDHEAIRLPPAEQSAAAEYWGDFYSWLMEQAAHVRAGRWEALDRENLAEEIESLGREQFNKLESALRVLMMHMLKWDHQPNLRSRNWVLSIEAQRLELDNVLSDNPGLKPRIAEATVRPGSKPQTGPDWKQTNSPSSVPIVGMTSLRASLCAERPRLAIQHGAPFERVSKHAAGVGRESCGCVLRFVWLGRRCSLPLGLRLLFGEPEPSLRLVSEELLEPRRGRLLGEFAAPRGMLA